MCWGRSNRVAFTQIDTLEMSSGGLPIANLGDRHLKINRNHRCITVVRATTNTFASGIGALVGMSLAPLVLIISRESLSKCGASRENADKWSLQIAAGALITGVGLGASAGKKVSNLALDYIFKSEKSS